MECSTVFLFAIFLICAVSCCSDRSYHEQRQQLAHSSDPIYGISLSPTPNPLPSLGSENAPSPLTWSERLTCDSIANKCTIQNYSVTACVPFVGNGAQATYIVVLNDGQSSLQLNFALLPENRTLDGLAISGHQVKKVNLPSNTRGDTSVLLYVGNEECTILFSAVVPQGFYTSYITSINATYLLFAAALFIGGSWACCKVVKRRNHLDGILYQELQMEQRDSSESTLNVGGWDQNWDEDWGDDEKGRKSRGMVRPRKVLDNNGS